MTYCISSGAAMLPNVTILAEKLGNSLLMIFISPALYLFSILSLLIKETWIVFGVKRLSLSLNLIK
jgi:hypothetical protein